MSNPLTETANQAINRISKMLDNRDREYQELQNRYANLKGQHKKDRELLKEILQRCGDTACDYDSCLLVEELKVEIKQHLGGK